MTRAPRYVGFLRAVNVGKRRVAMAALREEVEALGYGDVSTYVNSGNVVFSTDVDPAGLEPALEARLLAAFGFEVPTFVRTGDDVARVASTGPFGHVEPEHSHLVVFLRRPLPAATARAVRALSNDTDTLVPDGRELHWHIRGKVLDSSLTPRDWKALGDEPSTSRNVTMLAKLVPRL